MMSMPGIEGAERSQGRSMTVTTTGIVATSHVLASQAGAQVLARGGSAVDAAIAASAVLTVTEPMMNGIGGDLFVLYWDAKTRKFSGLNASGWAPRKLTIDALAARGFKQMPKNGIHTVTVPGCVDGWSKMHERFGKLAWKDLFGAAVHYAENGFPLPEVIQGAWGPAAQLKQHKDSLAVFAPNGKAPAVGDIFRNPDYGRALRLLAAGGAAEFYRGAIAKAILETSKALGGTLDADDLASFSSEWVEPISTTYRGWKIFELPPNGQGLAALEMLNMLENFEPAREGPSSAVELHKRIEAMKLAFADLFHYVGDPRHVKVPTDKLISKAYAAERAKLIDLSKASCQPTPGRVGSDTTYLTVVDREGNIASWIESIYAGWGSGITVKDLGFVLQNRGALFVLDPKHPNALAPRRRPFHTIIPAMMEKGDLHIGFGIMGGPNQPIAHMQFVSNVVDYGMNVQQAMEAPRFTRRDDMTGCEIGMENRVGVAARRKLAAMGHKITLRKEFSMWMGRGQAVVHNAKTKVNFGASDPRADGSAEPEPLSASGQ
ncbi:MAG: gamma-glutamyltransferase [Acidobacteria bacterium]|nr:gamma-glutamyltransferase [Acidobacteriota bacterium]MBI3282085.1 gamma-glutamyltransferase [Acidobacteriota bacterium]